MGYTNISRHTEACKHLISFNVFHSLPELSFHGNIQNILFVHVLSLGIRRAGYEGAYK